MLKTTALALGLLTACGGGQSSTPSTATPAPTIAPASSTVFELGEMQLSEGDTVVMKVHADGTTELGAMRNGTFEWQPGPVASTSGSITWGSKSLQVGADGTVTAEGQALPLRVVDDAIETSGGKLALSPEGTFTFAGQPPNKPLRVEGADTPGKRKLVLLLVALQSAGGPGEQELSGVSTDNAP